MSKGVDETLIIYNFNKEEIKIALKSVWYKNVLMKV